MGCVGSAAEHVLGGGRGVVLNNFWDRRPQTPYPGRSRNPARGRPMSLLLLLAAAGSAADAYNGLPIHTRRNCSTALMSCHPTCAAATAEKRGYRGPVLKSCRLCSCRLCSACARVYMAELWKDIMNEAQSSRHTSRLPRFQPPDRPSLSRRTGAAGSGAPLAADAAASGGQHTVLQADQGSEAARGCNARR